VSVASKRRQCGEEGGGCVNQRIEHRGKKLDHDQNGASCQMRVGGGCLQQLGDTRILVATFRGSPEWQRGELRGVQVASLPCRKGHVSVGAWAIAGACG
jgi:hypothetical protein